ncbi:hypothetical protein M2263_000147 [Providencia alcalifaciens]|nr:hypothetical protein [Providencia alcalifaciens]
MSHKTFEAIKATEIINAISHLPFFTAKRATALSNVNPSIITPLVKMMNKYGVISVVGKRSGVCEYKAAKNALEIIDKKFPKEPDIPVNENCNKDFKCEMRVVKKANVQGMGCPHLKRIDSLLSGVRV